MSRIKLGVTLYFFSTEYCKGTMTLEDCMLSAADRADTQNNGTRRAASDTESCAE